MAAVKTNDLKCRVDEWGRVLFPGEAAVELLLRGHQLSELLIEPNEEITRYNKLCIKWDKNEFCIADITKPIPSAEDDQRARIDSWFVPPPYCDLSVREELLARCQRPDEIERVNMEMDLFEPRGWLPLLRMLFYLVDDFRKRGIIWGVGRGSSVASYCLFLIGIHRIDSIAYDLSIGEFLRDE